MWDRENRPAKSFFGCRAGTYAKWKSDRICVQQHGQPELGRANAMDQNHQQSSEAAMKYRVGVLCAVFLLSCCLARAEEPAKTAKAAAQPTKKELEKKFQETLSGATLTGHFTSGKEDAAAAKEEKY